MKVAVCLALASFPLWAPIPHEGAPRRDIEELIEFARTRLDVQSIHLQNGLPIVKGTPQAHAQIRRLLDRLRAGRTTPEPQEER